LPSEPQTGAPTFGQASPSLPSQEPNTTKSKKNISWVQCFG